MDATLESIMKRIARAETEPGVYRVSLVASSHLSGFQAVIEMRGNGAEGYGGFSHQADDPVVALIGAESALLTEFGRCPTCGYHRRGKATS
jgi:hypothetical protein